MKSVNDTVGKNRLVITIIVFGIIPRTNILPQRFPEQMYRMCAMHDARIEMQKLVSSTRMQVALYRRLPLAVDNEVTAGEEVLMYREKPIGRWVGPYTVMTIADRMLKLDTGDRN